MRDDSAGIHALEAVLLSMVLLTAAYSVTTMRSERTDLERPRAALERVADDAMVVLSGLRDANGTLLDAYLLEALHCAHDATPSATSCEGRRGANLSMKARHYLPPGAGYAFTLDNGVKGRDVYRSALPEGETVTASFAYVPAWNFTFLMPELSCYEPGMDANVTALPLRNGGIAQAAGLTLSGAGGREVGAVRAHAAGAWNLTLSADVRGTAGLVFAGATDRLGGHAGAARLPACDLAGAGPALVEALRLGEFNATPATAPLGGRVTFRSDLASLAGVPGVTLLRSNVTVYAPLPPRGLEPDTYLPAAVVERATDWTTSETWTVPEDALYGAHPAVLRVALRLPDGAEVEARRVIVVNVGMADGTVPISPPYRAVLQVWFPDWR